MRFLLECVIGCLIFTLLMFVPTLINPLVQIHNYPEAIGQRAIELGLVQQTRSRRSKKTLLIKIIASFCFVIILTIAVYFVNGARNFLAGLKYSYLLWLVIDWFDAIVLDVILFCHMKRFILPGTEDMVKEYHDYWFHIKGSIIGMVIGLPICLLTGLFTMLFSTIFG